MQQIDMSQIADITANLPRIDSQVYDDGSSHVSSVYEVYQADNGRFILVTWCQDLTGTASYGQFGSFNALLAQLPPELAYIIGSNASGVGILSSSSTAEAAYARTGVYKSRGDKPEATSRSARQKASEPLAGMGALAGLIGAGVIAWGLFSAFSKSQEQPTLSPEDLAARWREHPDPGYIPGVNHVKVLCDRCRKFNTQKLPYCEHCGESIWIPKSDTPSP